MVTWKWISSCTMKDKMVMDWRRAITIRSIKVVTTQCEVHRHIGKKMCLNLHSCAEFIKDLNMWNMPWIISPNSDQGGNCEEHWMNSAGNIGALLIFVISNSANNGCLGKCTQCAYACKGNVLDVLHLWNAYNFKSDEAHVFMWECIKCLYT